jgi:hypothetical protein
VVMAGAATQRSKEEASVSVQLAAEAVL